MTSVNLKDRWGIQRTGQLCSEIFNDKLSRALQYTVNYSIYDAELTIRELTTSQSLLLSLFYGLLHQDVTFCLNLIEASSASVQLNSSYIKIWLKDDFSFKHDDVAKTFSNLAELLDCKFPSQLKLPQCIAVAFSGLVDKYKLLEVFNLSGDKKALEFVKALNSFVFGLTKNAELTLENNRESAGSELDEVELVSTPTKSNELEENTNGFLRSVVNDQEAVVELPTSVSNGVEPTLSSSQPELPTSDGDVAEPALSSSQPEIGDGASGSSKPTSTLPLSESQTSAINVEEPTLTLSESEIGNEVSIFPSVDSVPILSINKDRIYRSLMNAVRHNKLRSDIRNLIVPGINVNWQTESGDGLLHKAVYYGNKEAVVTLLEFGALPEMKNNDSITPLQLAVRLNLPSIFKALLEYVSNINQVFDKGNTILHEVASEGTSSDIDSVLRCKPFVDLKNSDGYTALHLATKSGHVSAVKALIKAGADVNMLSKKGESCLHIAVGNGNALILKKLLPIANIRYKNPITKFTALHTAAYNGYCDCIKVLLRQGLNVNVRSYNNRTALHEAAEQGHVSAVNLLLSWGAAVNAIAKNKCTPLHCAAASGFDQVVTALLNEGANINAKDSFGDTPLKLAKSKFQFLVEANLLLRGAKKC